jgi:HTH-type transcriptional regulator, cell division transcriptional repressor
MDASGDAANEWSDAASTFGDRLARARESVGLSQAQLAHRMGIRLQTVRNWEEDRSEPRANRLQMLAGMLNVSMVWLMSGQGEAPGDALAGEGDGDAAMRSLAVELRALRADQLRLADRLGRLEARLRRGAA